MDKITWNSGDEFKNDDANDILIVIPTVATPQTLIPSIGTLVSTVPPRTRIIVSINPIDKGHAAVCKDAITSLVLPNEVTIDIIEEDGPVGFGNAINQGIMYAANNGGLPKYTVIYNDDLHPVNGWLESMIGTFSVDHYNIVSAAPDHVTNERPKFQITSDHKIGIVGPVSNCAAGIQQVVSQETSKSLSSTNGGYEQFAHGWRQKQNDTIFHTEFLSGFCWMFSRECLIDMMISEDGKSFIGPFDGDQYPVAGYEDNDLCFRAVQNGWTLAIDYSNFIGHIGHQTFDKHFSDEVRGIGNRLNFFRKWQHVTQREDQKLIGAYRACFRNVNDMHLFKQSLLRNMMILDGVAILFTKNPLELQSGNDFQATVNSLTQDDLEMLKACDGATSEQIEEALTKWIVESVLPMNPNIRSPETKVTVWTQGFNERDERTACLQLAESMDADWVISIDADELFEDRLTRKHFDRAMMNPNPDVYAYNISWLNHWDSTRNVRLDWPWGDQGKFEGGMNGQRLYRVNKSIPAKIDLGSPGTGLHCGNIPQVGYNLGCVPMGARMRHLGYVRDIDRFDRYKAYESMDPNPNPVLVGNTSYGHIIDDEGMTLRPYVPNNGVGLTMLCYEKTRSAFLTEILRWTYNISDETVLVWTGEWKESDKKWANKGLSKIQSLKKWPKTGPSAEMAELTAFYKVKWIHKPLNDNIAEARNAGFDALSEYIPNGMSWALFLDPDESCGDWFKMGQCIRSMAEVTDGWGWLFKFHNILPNRGASYSERISMIRLDEHKTMRMNGRVHEGFENSTNAMRSMRINPKYRYCPVQMINVGLNQTEEDLYRKLKWYQSLLIKELEDNPLQPGAWVSLGLQYANDGDIEKSIQCMQRGVLCADKSYLPFKELGTIYLRLAAGLFENARDRVFEGHQFHSYCDDIVKFCKQYVEAPPALGTGIDTIASDGVDLPDFPMDDDMDLAEVHDRLVRKMPGQVQ